jgi:hypothetical protein
MIVANSVVSCIFNMAHIRLQRWSIYTINQSSHIAIMNINNTNKTQVIPIGIL